ncbi:hypothetical protein KBD45_04295 [Candidatus Dojkabacteria bacterium]|nr:hypothetical protein [Candidatus Dojkabacteria bacterium]
MNKLKGFSYKRLLNFKMLAIALYIVISVAIIIVIINYKYTPEMFNECNTKAKMGSNGDLWAGWDCLFSPPVWWLINVNKPGILIIQLLRENIIIHKLINSLSSNIQFFLALGSTCLISLSIYTFLGHLVDLFIRVFRNRGVNPKS